IDTQSTGNAVNLSGGGVEAVPTAANLAAGLPAGLLRASSDFDVRHALGFSVVYNTPTLSEPFANTLLSHWILSPIFHYQTAVPIDVIANTVSILAGATNLIQRPNVIPGVPVFVTGTDCSAEYAAAGRGSICPGGIAFNTAVPSAAVAASAGCAAP